MTNLLQFTINVQKSQHQNNTLQLVGEDHVFFILVNLHSSLCRQQHRIWKQAIHIMYTPFFCKLRSSSKPTHRNLTESGLEIQTALTWLPFRIRHLFT